MKIPPRKKLPVNPSLEHLQKQAKRRAKQNPALQLTAAQHEIAQEYGCKNWAELAQMIAAMAKRHDPTADRDKRYEPMPKAARARDLALVQQLLQEGAFTPLTLDQSLAHAVWYGKPSTWPIRKAIADLLLEHGADPDGQYGSGGYGPIVFGTGECIQPEGLLYLIEAGADVSFEPVQTKYGKQCPLSYILGSYGRGENDRKHRYLDILLQHRPYVPREVTPTLLAIHRGDVQQLGELLEREPGLVRQTFPDMPYGNVSLRGGTLLHCAVEFGEKECIAELLKRGADVNARAELVDGIGGQTPIFHAVATFPILEYFVGETRTKIDLSIRGLVRRHDQVLPRPMTVLEFAEHVDRLIKEEGGTPSSQEIALLRSLQSST
jgi:hypothetical protein